ncbi:hypothetical protein GEMRC1_004222 [Eukaryota sp. GEM-RC1]
MSANVLNMFTRMCVPGRPAFENIHEILIFEHSYFDELLSLIHSINCIFAKYFLSSDSFGPELSLFQIDFYKRKLYDIRKIMLTVVFNLLSCSSGQLLLSKISTNRVFISNFRLIPVLIHTLHVFGISDNFEDFSTAALVIDCLHLTSYSFARTYHFRDPLPGYESSLIDLTLSFLLSRHEQLVAKCAVLLEGIMISVENLDIGIYLLILNILYSVGADVCVDCLKKVCQSGPCSQIYRQQLQSF